MQLCSSFTHVGVKARYCNIYGRIDRGVINDVEQSNSVHIANRKSTAGVCTSSEPITKFIFVEGLASQTFLRNYVKCLHCVLQCYKIHYTCSFNKTTLVYLRYSTVQRTSKFRGSACFQSELKSRFYFLQAINLCTINLIVKL